jgi:hypothetical protein
MAVGRAPIVVGILAIAGGIAWFALRDSRPASDPAQGSGGLTGTPGSGKAAIFAPEGPSLGGSGNPFDSASGTPRPVLPDAVAIDAPSHRDVFSAQPRDPTWATRTEDELKDRVRKLTLTAVQAVDCRTDQCELTISGPLDAVDATIAKLEGPKGLPSVSKSMLLGGPERTGDTLTLRVYALFDR